MNKKVDYLIVGQGLAGTFLAFQLMRRGKKVMVVDKGLKYSASRVAAGVINPIVLRRFTVTWRAKEFLNYNSSFYSDLDAYLGKQYHFEIPLLKLISSQDEVDFWEHRYHKDDVSEYIHRELTEVNATIKPRKKFKVGTVKQASWLNISELLLDFRKHLHQQNALMEEAFSFSELDKNQYKNIEFGAIFFCEGAKGKENPLFKNLPLSLNKGQLLTVKSKELPSDSILKKKVFILPVRKDEFKIGASYSWKWDNSSEESAHQVEDDKTDSLKEQFEEMTTAQYKLINVETGIRPSVKDRRPIIGRHPDLKQVYIFNGMGTRGCFMAPLLTEEFINFVEHGKSLHPEVDVSRFKV